MPALSFILPPLCNAGKRFFLSGGIEPTDAAQVKVFMQEPVARELCAVDINSRFEILPGIKDMNKVKAFMEELRQAAAPL